jgi:prefoldin subunit 5
MAKKNQIDRAIESLEAQIGVLQLAIMKLREQQAKAPKRKPRDVARAALPMDSKAS